MGRLRWIFCLCSAWICITTAGAEMRTCSGKPVSWYVNYNKTLFHAHHYEIQTVEELEVKRCKLHCLANFKCHSFLFSRHGYGCQLLSSNKDFQGSRLEVNFAFHYYQWSCPAVTTLTVPKIPVTTPNKVTTPMKTTGGISKSTTPLLTNPSATPPSGLLSKIFSSAATQKTTTEKTPTSTTPSQGAATSTNRNPKRTQASTSAQPSTTTASSTTTETKHPNYAASSSTSGFGEREYIIIGCSVTAVVVVAAIVVSIAVCANNRNRKKAKSSNKKSKAKPQPQVTMVSTSVSDVKPTLPPRNNQTLERSANAGVKYTTLDGHDATMKKKHVTISRDHEVLGKRDSTNSEEFNAITECYSPVTDAYNTTRRF